MAKVAVIGAGVSGLYAAYQLGQQHDVTLYEKEKRIGGHAHTVCVDIDHQPVSVDMGFIVCNDQNYPLFNQWLKELGVSRTRSDMSFGVQDTINDILWSSKSPFGQRKNLLRWQHYQMFLDIIAFFNKAETYVQKNPDVKLNKMVNDLGRGKLWWQHFLYPMAASIWSTSFEKIHDFPAQMLVTFFRNHGLLSLFNHPQWYTIEGGSKTYIDAVLSHQRFTIAQAAKCVCRQKEGIDIEDVSGRIERFDQVIFAIHPELILPLLQQPTAEEQAILSVFKRSPQHVVLHQDERWMPDKRSCWASWNYRATEQQDKVTVTYWMNILQPFINTQKPLLVTLNPDASLPLDGVLEERYWSHPMFTPSIIQAQQSLQSLQGKNQTWYVGAYQRYGFHEDGLWSVSQIMPQWIEQYGSITSPT